MIICQDLLLELKLDLCFSDYTIKGNEGAYEGCTAPMKDPYDLCDDASFRNEEVWEREHVLDSARRTLRILDENYQRADLSKIVSISKDLNDNKTIMLRDVLNKYEFPFDGTLGTRKTRPVHIELQQAAKPYHDQPYLVPRAYKVVFRNEIEWMCQLRF